MRAADAGRRVLRLDAVDREHLVLTLWIVVTFRQFEGDQFLLYPMALYFAYGVARDFDRIWPLMRRCWPLFLVPAWWLLSPLWALTPAAAFRSGLQVLLTILICLYAAVWLTPRRVMLSVFVAAAIMGVLALAAATGGTGAAKGLFAHKNVLGVNMTILLIVSLCILLDDRIDLRIRVVAALSAALALTLVVWSRSVTGYLLSAGAASVILSGAILLRDGPLWRFDRLAVVFLALGLVLSAVAVVKSDARFDPVDTVLGTVGKDRTITGRTQLWEYAEQEIAKRPLLGIGPRGFWRYDASPQVQRIYEEFYKKPHNKFSFHNSYYEIAVHLGLIGFGLAAASVVWACFHVLRGMLGYGGMPFIFFGAMTMAMTIRTFTEADLFEPFVLTHTLIWIGAIFVIRAGLESAAALRTAAWRRSGRASGGRVPLGRAA